MLMDEPSGVFPHPALHYRSSTFDNRRFESSKKRGAAESTLSGAVLRFNHHNESELNPEITVRVIVSPMPIHHKGRNQAVPPSSRRSNA